MKIFCDFHGLTQLVRKPTRNKYLLDLVLTDIGGASVEVTPRIADHKGVLAKLPLSVVNETILRREMWILKNANWKCLSKALSEIDWSPLKRGTAEDAINYFLDILWTMLLKFIPRKEVEWKKSSHPWINDRCKKAIQEKARAEDTDKYEKMNERCSEILREECQKYIDKLKSKLSSLPRSSKQWWRINRELMHRKAKVSSIPPLREGKEWILNAKDKADSFARVFAAKNELPPEVVDTPFFGHADAFLDEFIPLRSRSTMQIFKKLNSDTFPSHHPDIVLWMTPGK